MADIASLGIRVTTTGAKEAAADLDKLKASGDKAEQAAKKITPAMSGAAKSAKELQFATRGLPAQFTDIATSLASGQRPFQVLLQQGGQIKDLFGGVGPALKAMGGYVAGLISPLTLAAGAIGLLGYAWIQAADQAEAFNKAIILTGNNANLTTSELEGMADQIDRTTTATAGKAADVLATVAASGRFTAEQIGLVSEAAIRMESATGKAIQDTIKEFVQLQDDPVSAILKLNDAQHFLTEETIKQIQSLKDQGDEAGAAAVAIRAYADTINTRAPEIEGHLSTWTALWRDLKSGAGEAFDAIVQGFRDTSGAAQGAIASTNSLLSSLSATGSLAASTFSTIFKLRAAQEAAANASGTTSAKNAFGVIGHSDSIVDSRAYKAKQEAEKDFASLVQSNLSKQAALEAEITKIKETGNKAGKSELEITNAIAEARARYAESLPKGKKPKKESTAGIENAQDRFADMVGRFQSELDGPLKKAEVEHVRRMREIEQAAKKAKIGHDELAQALALEGQAYQKNTDAIREGLASQVADLSGPVAQVQDEHARRLREIAQLTEDLGLSAAANGAMIKEEARAFEEASKAAERMADPMAAMLDDMQFELSLLSMTNAQRATAIQQRQLEAQGIKANTDALLAQNQAYEAQQEQIALLDEFRSSAADALSDFVTGAKSAKDALKDFFDSMAEMITRAIAQKWMEQLFGQQGTTQTGSSGGWISSIFGLLSGSGGDSGFGGAGSPLAKGGVMVGGNLTAFASGGIVNRATQFPMRDGRMGLMGEAGPEAILPLHRGPDGKLGVRMAANDDGPRERVVNNNTTFVLPDVVTRQTQDQWAQKQQRAATRATSRNR